jgi:hypothetical protein
MLQKPIISEQFTLEDIRKIRDYNSELFSTMTQVEIIDYFKESGERVDKEIAAIRRARAESSGYNDRVSP